MNEWHFQILPASYKSFHSLVNRWFLSTDWGKIPVIRVLLEIHCYEKIVMHVHLKHSLWVYVSMLAKVLKFDPINGFRAQGSGSRNAAQTPSEPISLKMLHTNHPDQCPYSMDRLVTCIYTHETRQKNFICSEPSWILPHNYFKFIFTFFDL